jgi:hypothetical protein
MSKSNRRRPKQDRSILRREVEKVDNAPGYANPPPWSLRGILTMYAVMMVINVPVAAVAMKLESQPSYWYSLVVINVFLYLLYALLAMPTARRLAHEARLMRPLESIAAGSLMYVVYVVSTSIALTLSRHEFDAHDALQIAGVGVAGLIGGGVGAALYPWVYRRFWMHRLPRGRR